MENINEIIRMEVEEQMKKVFKKMTKTTTEKKTNPASLLNQTRKTVQKMRAKNKELKAQLSATQKKLNKFTKLFK